MNKSLRIGSLELDGYAFLAPMAGISSSPFRRICRRLGASLVWSEMISAEGLLRAKGEAGAIFFKMLCAHPEERPLAVQLYSGSAKEMALASALVAELDADMVDINMGCPVKKVVKKGAGVALMRDLDRAKLMIKEVRRVIGEVPLTVKMRSGFSVKEINAPELCQIAEGEGANAVIVHARTREQGFSGKADWSIIRACVSAVKIPVIGNGDVRSKEDAERMRNETGCAFVMIGRGALGNPWLFQAIKYPNQALRGLAERKEIILWHFDMLLSLFGERKAVAEMRKHLGWYTKGMAYGIEIRRGLSKIKEPEELEAIIKQFFGMSQEVEAKKPSRRSREMGD